MNEYKYVKCLANLGYTGKKILPQKHRITVFDSIDFFSLLAPAEICMACLPAWPRYLRYAMKLYHTW